MKEFLNNFKMQDITEVFVIIFLTLLISYFVDKILGKIEKLLKKTSGHWDEDILDAGRKPLRYLILISGFSFAIDVFGRISKLSIIEAIDPIRVILVISVVTWFILRLINKLEINWVDSKRHNIDATTASAIIKLLRITIYITSGLIGLDSLGFSINGVLALGGAGGLSLGFASKDLVSNFFGALMIYLDKPFKVGDWIRSPDREIEGTVEDIGWRVTRIRTFDKRPLYVPNAIFNTISIENPSRMSNRRIREEIGVRYQDMNVVAKVVAEIKDMLKNHKEIDTKQTLIVNVLSFAPSSVDILIYTFTKTTVWIDYHEIKQDVMLKISDIIEKNGAEIAYPTTTLDIPKNIAIEQVGKITRKKA